MNAIFAIAVISALLGAVYVTSMISASAQSENLKNTSDHLKAFGPGKGLAKSAHVVVLDKKIHVGSNWIAFNPNIGHSKVVTVLSNK